MKKRFEDETGIPLLFSLFYIWFFYLLCLLWVLILPFHFVSFTSFVPIHCESYQHISFSCVNGRITYSSWFLFYWSVYELLILTELFATQSVKATFCHIFSRQSKNCFSLVAVCRNTSNAYLWIYFYRWLGSIRVIICIKGWFGFG